MPTILYIINVSVDFWTAPLPKPYPSQRSLGARFHSVDGPPYISLKRRYWSILRYFLVAVSKPQKNKSKVTQNCSILKGQNVTSKKIAASDDRLLIWKILNDDISATCYPIHFMFGFRVGFTGLTDRMVLLPVGPNPSWWSAAILENCYIPEWSDYVMYLAVVMFCHSKRPIAGRFLLRAQEHNMTNGDFAFFTFFTQPSFFVYKPWIYYTKNKDDIPRLQRVFQVVKQVYAYHSSLRSDLITLRIHEIFIWAL